MIENLKTAANTANALLSGTSRERPFQSLSDEEVLEMYVRAMAHLLGADESGRREYFIAHQASYLKREWEARGNDTEKLSEALQEAGHSRPY